MDDMNNKANPIPGFADRSYRLYIKRIRILYREDKNVAEFSTQLIAKLMKAQNPEEVTKLLKAEIRPDSFRNQTPE